MPSYNDEAVRVGKRREDDATSQDPEFKRPRTLDEAHQGTSLSSSVSVEPCSQNARKVEAGEKDETNNADSSSSEFGNTVTTAEDHAIVTNPASELSQPSSSILSSYTASCESRFDTVEAYCRAIGCSFKDIEDLSARLDANEQFLSKRATLSAEQMTFAYYCWKKFGVSNAYGRGVSVSNLVRLNYQHFEEFPRYTAVVPEKYLYYLCAKFNIDDRDPMDFSDQLTKQEITLLRRLHAESLARYKALGGNDNLGASNDRFGLEMTREMLASEFEYGTINVLERLKVHMDYAFRRTNDVYVRVVAMVQSSGCGKTKLLAEFCKPGVVSNVRMGRYLNFRMDLTQGVPIRTSRLSDFVLRMSTIVQWTFFILAFLSTPEPATATERRPHPFMASYSDEFVDNVLRKYDGLFSAFSCSEKSHGVRGCEYESQENLAKHKVDSFEIFQDALYEYISTHCKDVVSSLLADTIWVDRIVMVLDDVNSGWIRKDEANFRNMRRAVRVICSCQINLVVVIVDTACSIAGMPPLLQYSPSDRSTTCSELLLPYYMLEVPIRIMKVNMGLWRHSARIDMSLSLIADMQSRLTVLYTPMDLCILSRPTFWHELQFLGDDVRELESHLRRMAEKATFVLVGALPLYSHNGARELAALAVANCRYFTRSLIATESEQLVRFNAAFLAGLNRYAGGASVGYRPEPMLMEAALQRMAGADNPFAHEVLRLIHTRFLNGTLETISGKGDLVELVGSYILLRAYDYCTTGLHSSNETQPSQQMSITMNSLCRQLRTKPLPVSMYLQQLTGGDLDAVRMLAAGRDDAVARIVQYGVVRITHAERAETGQLDSEYVSQCFRRGTMILCSNNEICVDVIIPVAVPVAVSADGAATMDLRIPSTFRLSGILVQIKNYKVSAMFTASERMKAADNMNALKMDDVLPGGCVALVLSTGSSDNIEHDWDVMNCSDPRPRKPHDGGPSAPPDTQGAQIRSECGDEARFRPPALVVYRCSWLNRVEQQILGDLAQHDSFAKPHIEQEKKVNTVLGKSVEDDAIMKSFGEATNGWRGGALVQQSVVPSMDGVEAT